jgi:phage terminase large subunit-like protein
MTTALEHALNLLDPPQDTMALEPHQIPPAGRWFVWMLLGGRGAGKTAADAYYMHRHVHGPPCDPSVPGGHWPSIIAPTLGDAVTSCVNGPSGLRKHCPEIKVTTNAGGTMVRWPNGVEAKLFGAHTPEDVERLRSGGNRCLVWAEELAAWRYLDECWQHMRYGLRLGARPHVVVSTTPKARTLIKKLVKQSLDQHSDIAITRATTDDNPHLPGHIKRALYEDYGGTRLGRQELYAEILEDVDGALWNIRDIEEHRINPLQVPDLWRIVVGVDPAITADGDYHGIVVCGVTAPYEFLASNLPTAHLTHGFVLADESLQGTPHEWASKVRDCYYDYNANLIVPEINQGGDMVAHTLRTLDDTLPVRPVTATRGKMRRAEPISNMYQQGRVHHVGQNPFAELEDQMTTWDATDPTANDFSPDRMDALVWALTDLMVSGQPVRTHTVARDVRLTKRR